MIVPPTEPIESAANTDALGVNLPEASPAHFPTLKRSTLFISFPPVFFFFLILILLPNPSSVSITA